MNKDENNGASKPERKFGQYFSDMGCFPAFFGLEWSNVDNPKKVICSRQPFP